MTRTRDVATQGGLVLLNTGTFTASSSVSINSVFTSTYDNYLINIYGEATTTATIGFRFNSGGTALTTGYSGAVTSPGDAGNSSIVGSNSATSMSIGYIYSASYTGFDLSFNIYDATNTNHYPALSGHGRSSSAIAGYAANQFGGARSTKGAVDGFTLLVSAGTFTGKYKIYGMRN